MYMENIGRFTINNNDKRWDAYWHVSQDDGAAQKDRKIVIVK